MHCLIGCFFPRYECSLLGSVLLQVLSGSMNMFDSYMSFLVGAALVYNTSYRSLELVFTKNHGGASFSHACCVACVVADLHPSSYRFFGTEFARFRGFLLLCRDSGPRSGCHGRPLETHSGGIYTVSHVNSAGELQFSRCCLSCCAQSDLF